MYEYKRYITILYIIRPSHKNYEPVQPILNSLFSSPKIECGQNRL